jgi:hypothetical protein
LAKNLPDLRIVTYDSWHEIEPLASLLTKTFVFS